MTRLHELYDGEGQSPWLDNLTRADLRSNVLRGLVDEGVRGVTSNPTTFAKAIAGSQDYDEQFADLVQRSSVEDAYWTMVVDDVGDALEVLRPLHEASGGGDGFVSLEVPQALAFDTEGTAASARALHSQIARSNLMVKIPGTAPGVAAVGQMVAEGRNINVTLLFGLERYDAIIEAYLSGLEACEGDLSRVHGVASFFLSRVDTEVDRRLEAVGTPEALALRGKAAVAQAKLAYRLFQKRFSGPRWEALAGRGANLQRPLWASTSTKNPVYHELLYVETLMGPDTVNTLPEATLEALRDRGRIARTVDRDVEQAEAIVERLTDVGVQLADVSTTLEEEGVSAFAKSFDELLQALGDKAGALAEGRSTRVDVDGMDLEELGHEE